jgi:hypothetical protein
MADHTMRMPVLKEGGIEHVLNDRMLKVALFGIGILYSVGHQTSMLQATGNLPRNRIDYRVVATQRAHGCCAQYMFGVCLVPASRNATSPGAGLHRVVTLGREMHAM